MYNLHVENKRQKNKTKQKKPNYKKWQTAFVHHEKVYNLQMKTSTKTLHGPQFGFRQAEKNNLKTLFLTTKSKIMTSRLQKKRETKKSS